jgi:hypothetical protein
MAISSRAQLSPLLRHDETAGRQRRLFMLGAAGEENKAIVDKARKVKPHTLY